MSLKYEQCFQYIIKTDTDNVTPWLVKRKHEQAFMINDNTDKLFFQNPISIII